MVKIGSSLLYCADGLIHFSFLKSVADQVSELIAKGNQVIIVSSGAIAFGMHMLGLKDRPKELSYLQAAAAIGQHELMDAYRQAFKDSRLKCAQLLLTWEDFDDRSRYLNAKNTLQTLLKLGSVPVVNENDTVSTDEIKFGDNDRLSAMVASLVSADLLIILSDVAGLLDKGKSLVRLVQEITPQIKSLACPTNKKTCVGGMITKIQAAETAVNSGVLCVIASGHQDKVVCALAEDPASTGTLFASKAAIAARSRWIAFGAKPKGKIVVDDGAKKALLNKKSLLSVGVAGFSGDFACGSTVSVVDAHKHEFARGKVGISSKQLENVAGKRSDKEVIHRDNIVLL